MFIRRKSKIENLSKIPKVFAPERKQQQSQVSTHSIDSTLYQPDLKIKRYPFLEYLVSLCMFLFSVYLFASLAGIEWGLLAFHDKEWWQFVVSALVLAFSIAIMFNSDCEFLLIIKKNDEMIHSQSKFFCLFQKHETHKISQITKIQIRQCGAAKKVSLHTRWYGNEVSFLNCRKVMILRCISQENAERYRQSIIKTINLSNKIISS